MGRGDTAVTSDEATPARTPGADPTTFFAAAAALEAIQGALRNARESGSAPPPSPVVPEQALASLLLLRQVREELAAWETGLIETARQAGASWADLSAPLGVASRQAAERRYLRLRPGDEGSTGEERVQATRDRRAADRTVTAWARENSAELRTLAAQVAALTDLPAAARGAVGKLRKALADDDTSRLIAPLAGARPYLPVRHQALIDRIDVVTDHTARLRQDSTAQRQSA
jgi:hypothetical protein